MSWYGQAPTAPTDAIVLYSRWSFSVVARIKLSIPARASGADAHTTQSVAVGSHAGGKLTWPHASGTLVERCRTIASIPATWHMPRIPSLLRLDIIH